MTVLLILVLPLTFLLYSVFSKDTSGTFTAFLLGLIAGLASLLVVSFLPSFGSINSPSFWGQTVRFFFDYFLLHIIFGLGFFFLISFSISGEVLDTSFSALFGIFSTVFANVFYELINVPIITEQLLFLLIIIGSILVFDFVFNILIANLTIAADFVVYLISLIPFVLLCFLGSTALASFYLQTAGVSYILISAGICVAGIILNAILAFLD